MPTSIYLPYVNIALNAFALCITLIVLIACISERSNERNGARYFLLLLISVSVALLANILAWVGEGKLSLAIMTAIANTVADCARQVAILSFMGYLILNLYSNSRLAIFLLNVFHALCVFAILFSIGNVFFGYVFAINEQGHWYRSEHIGMGALYLILSIFHFFCAILLILFAKSSTKFNRLVFFIYTLFPVAGVIIDYTVHGISLTYLGFALSILSIYTGLYLKRQKQFEMQRNALMISQINPHFVYNTLSTIASMCDTSPKQAKYLTIDFAQYLRSNIASLTSEDLISFDKEMEHVACYLKIEKARFRERLNVIYAIQCKDFKVPPLTLQPLVENAVKHGITKNAGGGTVKISTYEEDTYYVVEIIDDGVGFDAENAEKHVGIENVRSRVAGMCKGELIIKSTLGVGTRVRIEIPKTKGSRR